MSDPLDKLGSQKSGVDIGSVLRPIRNHKWLILAITLTIPIAVGFLVSKQPKVFQSTATVIIELSVPQYMGNGFKDVVEAEPSWWSSRETMETEFRVLRSRSQALRVAKALCGVTFNGAPALRFLSPSATCAAGATGDYDKAAGTIQNSLRVEPMRESRLVQLIAVAPNPQYAALLANTIAHVYVEQNLERRLMHQAGAANWLGGEYEILMKQLREAEDALVSFKQQNNIVAVALEDSQNELSNKRKKIAEELNTLEVKLIGIRTQREQFAAFRTADPVTELNPALADSVTAQKLKEQYLDQYAKLIEVKGKYLDKHPIVIAQEMRVNQAKEYLSREVEISRKNIELQFEMLNKQVSQLRAALDETTRKALALELKSSEYNRLKREFDRLVKLTEQVGGREQETDLASHLKTNNVHILDEALVPLSPVAPDVPKAVALAAGVALLLAIGLAVLLESLDSSVKTQDDVEKYAGMTFLGIIPSIDLETEKAAAKSGGLAKTSDAAADSVSRDTFVLSNPQSSVAECCRSIRTNLLFMSPDKPAKTLLVTSAGPQEGKTTVAVNMAITLAQSGLKVLLVDTDMRRPRLHRALGLPGTADGISKAIVGEADARDQIRTTDVPNLWLLPCGAIPPNPAELLHADRFKRIVSVLGETFDHVIFDSPPVGVVTDAAILARLTDGTIMVAKAGRTARDALARATRQVSADGHVNLLGCILNDLDLNKQSRYGYYYYYYYSRYGGYYTPSDKQA
jgi:succinoglycan biosynthesis transport protein ExoP